MKIIRYVLKVALSITSIIAGYDIWLIWLNKFFYLFINLGFSFTCVARFHGHEGRYCSNFFFRSSWLDLLNKLFLNLDCNWLHVHCYVLVTFYHFCMGFCIRFFCFLFVKWWWFFMCWLLRLSKINLIIEWLDINHWFLRLFCRLNRHLDVFGARVFSDAFLDWDLNIITSELWWIVLYCFWL